MHRNPWFNLDTFIELDPSPQVVKAYILAKRFEENQLFEYIWTIVRRGNIELLRSRNKKNGPITMQIKILSYIKYDI
jgi:hypothetical protein